MNVITSLTAYTTDLMRRFRDEEDGLALTEYLVVLALLVGGVIVAVQLFGTNLAAAWTTWAGWITSVLGQIPT